MANVLKQFRRRYIYPWLKPPLPYKQATLAGTRVSYKNHLDGGDAALGKILSLSCKALDYQDSRALSSGVPDRDLSDSRCWAMAFARRSV